MAPRILVALEAGARVTVKVTCPRRTGCRVEPRLTHSRLYGLTLLLPPCPTSSRGARRRKSLVGNDVPGPEDCPGSLKTLGGSWSFTAATRAQHKG